MHVTQALPRRSLPSVPRRQSLQKRSGRVSKPLCTSASKVDQSEEYNAKMKKAMGWKDADPYQYHYDRGLYWHEIIPDLICGSQPRNTADMAELKNDVGATTIINVSISLMKA